MDVLNKLKKMISLDTDTQEIIDNNLKHTLTSWSKQKGLKPIVVDKAEGVYLYSKEGKRYIDFSSQLICVNIGHGHPKVAEAVAEQMREVSYVYPGIVTKSTGEIWAKSFLRFLREI